MPLKSNTDGTYYFKKFILYRHKKKFPIIHVNKKKDFFEEHDCFIFYLCSLFYTYHVFSEIKIIIQFKKT